jgi:soluble lytic murein transglycosylase-like protein
MTWSGATADMKLSLDEFAPTAAKANSKAFANAAPAEAGSAEPVHVDIPMNVSAADIAREAPVRDTAQKSAQDAQPQFAEPERIPLPPIPKPVVYRTHREICDTLTEAAESNNLPVPFFIRLLFQESRFQAGIVSNAGAQGIAQFMPDTAADVGLKNPFDPLQAIPASARLLRNLVSQFGNLGLAAAAYNAGPKRIQDWLGKKGKLPEETQGYVRTITGRPAETWTASEGYSGQRIPRHAPCQEAAGLYASSGPETIPLPVPSPRTQHDVTPVASKRMVASATPPLKITALDARVTATIAVATPAKPQAVKVASSGTGKGKIPAGVPVIMTPEKAPAGVKAMSQQLAASKHKSDRHRLKIAQR